MVEPSPDLLRELDRYGGPRSALHLVPRGEDPRVLATDPDLFFRRPSTPAAVLGFAILLVLSVLGVQFITMQAWNAGAELPWFWYVIWLIFPWVFVGPLWAWWFRRQWLNAEVRRGRAAVAALTGTPAEAGKAMWVSFGTETSSPTKWRGLSVAVVAETAAGEVPFRNARTKKRWPSWQTFGVNDPIWIWRGVDGWVFGQVAQHGHDPTYTPPGEPAPPTWESLHGGHSPEYFRQKLAELAAEYRAGSLTRQEHDAAVKRLWETE